MPTAPPRQCNRCLGRVPYGERCPCIPAWSGKSSASARRNGSTRRSRARRDAMLCANPLCANDCGRLAEIDDHVKPIAEGGDLDDPANHQGLCRACSDEKSRAEAARGRARGR